MQKSELGQPADDPHAVRPKSIGGKVQSPQSLHADQEVRPGNPTPKNKQPKHSAFGGKQRQGFTIEGAYGGHAVHCSKDSYVIWGPM